jgi:hypothetical protein
MLQSTEVCDWISNSRSQTLVINGNEASHSSESATSLLSALIIQALTASDDCVVLHWLCGRNIQSNTMDMAASRLSQPLEAGADLLPVHQCFAGLGATSSGQESLFQTLSHCIAMQLRRISVFCICDSISCYEDWLRKDGVVLLNQILASVVKSWEEEHQLKVLYTSPTKRTYLGSIFDQTNPTVLTVPGVVAGASVNLDAFLAV